MPQLIFQELPKNVKNTEFTTKSHATVNFSITAKKRKKNKITTKYHATVNFSITAKKG